MKITAPERVAPDGSHILDPSLFGDDDRFELSTIRPEDASIAMEMLIGNYASPMDAVIRELFVNADDSHRAAGQTCPVEITMPTEESPFLIVRDFGLGMSPTDMVGVFTRPAASTKRDENVSTGGLGIGAKAPFTVADRFVVRGVKGGVSATLIMARIDGHLMHLVNEVVPAADGQSNGVEITVPIEASKIEKWWKALSRVHFWWNEGRAVVTNADASPISLPTWSERILEGAPAPDGPAVVLGTNLGKPTVLMGQIAYSVPDTLLSVHIPLLYIVPVGAVRIAPNRESLVDTEENRQLLQEMARNWQSEQFDDIGAKLMNPTTSMMTLSAIESDIVARGLEEHFKVWIHQTHPIKDFYEERTSRVPRYGLSNAVCKLMASLGPEMRVHGMHGDTAAKQETFSGLLWLDKWRDQPRRVYVDSRTLPDSRRKVLTQWARSENVVAVLVNREHLEAVRFNGHWGSSYEDDSFTRPFATEGEIEWVDAADIRVERTRPKTTSPAPTGASEITVIGLSRHHRTMATMTVDELATHTRKRSNRWVIVDTVAEISKIDQLLPSNIKAVPSGQRPAALLRDKLGSRALTVAEFLPKVGEYVERSLTAVQKREIADTVLAGLNGVSHLFRSNTAWIEETEDPDVRAIAQEISVIVTRSLRNYEMRGKKPFDQQVLQWASALKLQLNDPDWLTGHASLGKFAPALIAARTTGLLHHYWSYSTATVEHVRATIATQLVKS